MAFSILTRPAAILCLATAVTFAGRSALAAVPESVAVRQQSPDVEQIISQLEAKAAGATGTWTTKSARKDMPAEEWTTTISGREWTLKSLATIPSSSHGFSLYCDGEDCFARPDGVQFQNDTLTQGRFQDFRIGHYLLLLNLEPRQLIGSLGGLTLLENAMINGVAYEHLQADLSRDPLIKSDTAVKPRTALLPRIDLYVDLHRQAVFQVSITDRAGSRFETTVTSWDNFGTSSSWPKNVIGHTYLDGMMPLREIEEPNLITIERFDSGPVQDIADMKKAVASRSFFSAPPTNLRSIEFYKKAVERNSSDLNAKVALIQTSFNEDDVPGGLSMWTMLESQLAGPDQEELRHVVVPHAAYALWTHPKTNEQVAASVEVMQKLLKDLSSEELKAICISLYVGWENLYTDASRHIAIEPVNAQLMALFSSAGEDFVFGRLVQLSQKKQYKETLNTYFQTLASKPLPASGYSLSPLSYLVAASIQAHELDIASGYLRNIIWDTSTPESSKKIVLGIEAAIDRAKSLNENSFLGLTDILESFNVFMRGVNANDRISAEAVQMMLVEVGSQHVVKVLDAQGQQSLLLGKQDAAIPGASIYWDHLLKKLLSDFERSPSRLITVVGPLLKEYGRVFDQPQYEATTWMTLARSATGYLGIQVEYLNKALVAATDDPTRFSVVQMLGSTYASVHEYAVGAQVVEGAAQQLRDVSFVIKAQKVRDDLFGEMKKEQVRAAEIEKKAKIQTQEQLLGLMKNQLDAARKNGASAGDIASLEKVVQSIENSPQPAVTN